MFPISQGSAFTLLLGLLPALPGTELLVYKVPQFLGSPVFSLMSVSHVAQLWPRAVCEELQAEDWSR